MYDRKNDPVRGSARNLFAAWCGRNRIRRPFSCERWFTLFEVTHLDGLHDVRQGRLHGSSPAAGSNGARGVAGAKTALLGGEGLFPHARTCRATLTAPASSGAPRGAEVSLLRIVALMNMSAHSRMQATGLAGLILVVACGQAAIDGQHVARPSVYAMLHRFGHGGLRLRGGAQPSALVTRDLYGKAIRLGNPQKTRPSAHVSASPSSLLTHWIWTS